MWSIVLISQPPSVEISVSLPGKEEHISVFLPCAPNPTTGFFFYVPKSKVIEVEMSAEDAATLIMSAGVVQPGSDQQKKIAALAEMANAARLANTARCNRSLRRWIDPSGHSGAMRSIELWCAIAHLSICDSGSGPSDHPGMTVDKLSRPDQRHRLVALEQIEQQRSASPRSPFSFGLSFMMRSASSRACVMSWACTSERAMR